MAPAVGSGPGTGSGRTSAQKTGMWSLTPSLLGHVFDYFSVEETSLHGRTSANFKAAIEKVRDFISDCTENILSHPLLFVKFSGLHRVTFDVDDDSEFSRLLAVACSGKRRWRELHIFCRSPSGVRCEDHFGELAQHFTMLTGAIRAGVFAEFQDLSLYGFKAPDLPTDAHEALLRLGAALPARVAIRLMISLGFGKEAILALVDASPSLDLNEMSQSLDPVAVTLAMNYSSKYKYDDLLRELKRRGRIDLDRGGPLSQQFAFGVAIQQSLDCAEIFLELGADPNGGSPAPLLVLCGAQNGRHFNYNQICGNARLRRVPMAAVHPSDVGPGTPRAPHERPAPPWR